MYGSYTRFLMEAGREAQERKRAYENGIEQGQKDKADGKPRNEQVLSRGGAYSLGYAAGYDKEAS